MALESILPQEEGMYRFVVFEDKQVNFYISTKAYNESMHVIIARDFNRMAMEKGIKMKSIIGGGILDYTVKDSRLVFHVGSSFGPSQGEEERIADFRKAIEAAMKLAIKSKPGLKYETPLDEANEPVRSRSMGFSTGLINPLV